MHAVKPSAGTDRQVGRESVSSGDRSAVAGRFQVPGARHWLRAQEKVRFKTVVLMYKATHGTAPSYLSQLVRVADLPGRRSLRSARTNRLLVLPEKLSTVGGRAFPVAGPTI